MSQLTLTLGQLADALQLSRITVTRMLKDGRIGPVPSRLSPNKVRFDASEVREWVAAGMPPRSVWSQMKRYTLLEHSFYSLYSETRSAGPLDASPGGDRGL
jgi:excisionase family DNA binding protein